MQEVVIHIARLTELKQKPRNKVIGLTKGLSILIFSCFFFDFFVFLSSWRSKMHFGAHHRFLLKSLFIRGLAWSE